MIPDKRKTRKTREYKTTELQHLAQQENFALFILKSIRSQLIHLDRCPSIKKSAMRTVHIKVSVTEMIQEIKNTQLERKIARTKVDKESSNG